MGKLYIGVMSGTSMDSVDVALCQIDQEGVSLIASLEYPFDSGLKSELIQIIERGASLQVYGAFDHRLGRLFSDAVLALMKQEKLENQEIEAIGLHGQTVWHEPQGETPFSMQWGDPNIVVAATGIRTVADFRRADMARGGQGAPLAPAFHQAVFGSKACTAVLNIGGMANVTVLGDEVLGFDTGPGNVLMDYWMEQSLNEAYDKEGAFARSGQVHQPLLEHLKSDPYFALKAPKSTGREYFNAQWLNSRLAVHSGLDPKAVQATLLELSAQTIADTLLPFAVDTLYVCGGGAKNSYLMERLQQLLDTEVQTTDSAGISADSMEAMAFAWLAFKRVNGESVAIKAVTGASDDTLLGAIYG